MRLEMYEDNEIVVPLSEDYQDARKFELEKDSKKNILTIKYLLHVLEDNFNNDIEFENTLKIIHGRFSKVELNLNQLERLKNEQLY